MQLSQLSCTSLSPLEVTGREEKSCQPLTSARRCAQNEHLRPNKPCIFPASLVQGWPCFRSFVAKSGQGPNIDYAHLAALYESTSSLSESLAPPGAAVLAPVHRPSTAAELEYGYPPTVCDERSLSEVFALWQSGEGKGLYVKDWHLALAVEAAGQAPFYDNTWAGYTVDDWLNGFYRAKGEDFRFVVRPGSVDPLLDSMLTWVNRSISARPARRLFSTGTCTAATRSRPMS